MTCFCNRYFESAYYYRNNLAQVCKCIYLTFKINSFKLWRIYSTNGTFFVFCYHLDIGGFQLIVLIQVSLITKKMIDLNDIL